MNSISMFQLMALCIDLSADFAIENEILMPEPDELFPHIFNEFLSADLIQAYGVREDGEIDYEINRSFTAKEVFNMTGKIMDKIHNEHFKK